MPDERLIFLALWVHDLERSVAFYRDTLGIPLHEGFQPTGDPWTDGQHHEYSWRDGAYLHFALFPTRAGGVATTARNCRSPPRTSTRSTPRWSPVEWTSCTRRGRGPRRACGSPGTGIRTGTSSRSPSAARSSVERRAVVRVRRTNYRHRIDTRARAPRAPAPTPASAAAPRRAAGRHLRSTVPRSRHAEWSPQPGRDPLALLDEQNRSRLADLVPLRWARMLESPFAFLRGAAVVMAHDLADTAITGLRVQLCGDAHVENFGVFASPERDQLFDITDFDETLSGPFEWDVKRLAASAVVAARDAKRGESAAEGAAQAGVRSYREAMLGFAEATVLDTWYARADQAAVQAMLRGESRRELNAVFDHARGQTSTRAFPALAELTKAGEWRIVDHPPAVSHESVDEHEVLLRRLVATYGDSLADDRRVLLGRFELRDLARKVVGIGSVGTRCFVALLESDMGEPLFLQVKEAQASVLAPYVHAPPMDRQGRRVVAGQRLMQADSDIFLGWADTGGADFYVRQLRDMKGTADLETMPADVLADYVRLCGWTLARAHARSGDAPSIAGYLGGGEQFDAAVTRFAVAYADQTVRDHQALVDAVKAGRVTVAST